MKAVERALHGETLIIPCFITRLSIRQTSKLFMLSLIDNKWFCEDNDRKFHRNTKILEVLTVANVQKMALTYPVHDRRKIITSFFKFKHDMQLKFKKNNVGYL
jgi:hypothetical protein